MQSNAIQDANATRHPTFFSRSRLVWLNWEYVIYLRHMAICTLVVFFSQLTITITNLYVVEWQCNVWYSLKVRISWISCQINAIYAHVWHLSICIQNLDIYFISLCKNILNVTVRCGASVSRFPI